MNKTLLLLAALAATASTHAALNDTEPVLLPAYVIEAPRRTDAEAKIDSSLAEFRRAASNVVKPALHVPALPATEAKAATMSGATRATPPAFRVAVKA